MPRALIDAQNEYFTGALPISHLVAHLDNILKVMDAASRQAMHLGYKVEFLNDATGTLPVSNSAGA